MSRKKNKSSRIIDGFVDSVNRTGESNSWIVAAIFLLGGLFATYIGYSGPYLPSLIGGPLAILIGLMLMYKSFHMHFRPGKRRR